MGEPTFRSEPTFSRRACVWGSPKMVRPGYRRYPKFRRSQGTGGLIYT